MRTALAWLAVGLVLPAAVRAQGRTVLARVVQVAGSSVYLDAGTAQGLSPADTVAVRRAAQGPRIGTLAVIAVTETRSVVGFVGQPFPITFGDSLLLTLGAGGAGVGAAGAAPPAAPRLRAQPAALRREVPGPSLRGSAAFDVNGATTTTIGFGVDPERANRDFAVPSLRLQLTADNLPGGGRFSFGAKGSQQVGTADLFDRSTVLRVYDAHYEQSLSAARVMVGRFFTPFERFSGLWDGALVRVGSGRGFSLGVAGGFQPKSGDETFSTAVPKLAAFAGFGASGAGMSWAADLSGHIWRPNDGTADRTFVGWSQRLILGGARLDHLMEVDRSATGAWSMTRLSARAAVPVGSGFEVSAEYWRDRLHWWDTLPDSVAPSRERASAGLSYGSRGMWLSGDVTLLLSGTDVQGHSYAGSLRFPLLGGRAWLGGAASYWSLGSISGLVATPNLSWQLGPVRPSLTYEFFRSSAAGTSSTSHGGVAAVSVPLARRLQWLLQLRMRYGQNLQSAGLYSSLRVTF